MQTRIDTKTGRAKLSPRRDPYWHRLRIGFYLGFRALEAGGVGTWITRRLIEGSYRFKALGDVTTLDFEAAIQLAETWAAELDRGVGVNLHGKTATVALACREYVEATKTARPTTAHNAELFFRRTVYEHEIARRELAKLREKHLNDWRDQLLAPGYSRSSANRTLTALKAALNHAVRSRLAPAHLSFEVRCVQLFKNASRRRELFLDQGERRRLLEAADGSVRDLIEAAALTGARAGELTSARRSAFDARRHSITLTGKTGTRTVPLSPAACALFARLSENKLPQAYLLTRDNGAPWKHSGWDTLVRMAALRARLPEGVVLYTLRHSFITETLLAGIPTLTVAKMVGTSLQMIEKHYGHLVAQHAREQLAAVKLI